MNIKKSWTPMMGVIGLVLIMMTAASVCAEDPLARENPLPNEGANSSSPTDGDDEPLLIAPAEIENTTTGDIPDYENYTGDMLISPGPAAKSDPMSLPLVGGIGAGVIIVVVLIGIALRQKKD